MCFLQSTQITVGESKMDNVKIDKEIKQSQLMQGLKLSNPEFNMSHPLCELKPYLCLINAYEDELTCCGFSVCHVFVILFLVHFSYLSFKTMYHISMAFAVPRDYDLGCH